MKNSKKVDGTREFAAAIVERKLRRRRDRAAQGLGLGMGRAQFRRSDERRRAARASRRAEAARRDDSAHRQQAPAAAARVPRQSRTACRPQKDGSCTHPFMMINDLGKTFGQATLTNADKKSAVNFEAWSDTPMWKDDRGCVAQLSKSFTGSLEHPKISEERTQVPRRAAGAAHRSAAARSVRGRALHEARSEGRRSTTGSACSSRSATRSRTRSCANPVL